MVLNCLNSLAVAPFWERSEKAGTAFPVLTSLHVLSSLQLSPLGPEQLSAFIHSQTQKFLV